MKAFSDQDLALWLLRQAAAGRLSQQDLRQCLDTFFPQAGEEAVLGSLLARLEQAPGGAAAALRGRLLALRQERALAWHAAATWGERPAATAFPELAEWPPDLPGPWAPPEGLEEAARRAAEAVAQRLWQRTHAPTLDWLATWLDERLVAAYAAFTAYPERWSWLTLRPPAGPAADAVQRRQRDETPDAATLTTTAPTPALLRALEWRLADADLSETERRDLLDRMLAWPSPLAAAPLARACQTPAMQDRATVALGMRLGRPAQGDWSAARAVLEVEWQRAESLREELQPFCLRQGATLCWLYLFEGEATPNATAVALLEGAILEKLPPRLRDELADQVAAALGPQQAAQVLAATAPAAALDAVVAPPTLIPARPAPAPTAAATPTPAVPAPAPPVRAPVAPPEPEEPAEPPAPSVWQEHLQPFLLANWYMVAGLLMVLVGAALLAYFSWSNVLLRFTVTPVLLALFTVGLGGLGGWLERREEALRGTAAMLRGGALCLIPVNLMTLPLLARAPELPAGLRLAALGGGALAYLALFGWGAWRWSRAVHPGLGRLLAPGLVTLNALLPLAAIAGLQSPPQLGLVVAGCYAAAGVAGALTLAFLRRVMDADLLESRRVPWFYGVTLALTLAEVFALAHWALGAPPTPSHYGALAVLLGGLVLESERRVLQLRGESDRLGGESFLGFAAIALGILLAANHLYLRIAVLLLAAVVWLRQAGGRRGDAHHWLGLSLGVAGLAAIGLLPDFPRGQAFDAVGPLGLAIALALGAVRVGARRLTDPRLAQVAAELQPLVLALTAVATPISQWHSLVDPRQTAAVLLAVAALFAWRAHRLQRLAWVHTAVATLVLALPYLGCADMVGRSVRGNTLVFGLAVIAMLWIALTAVVRRPLLAATRSSVLWGLGALAVAAMVLRLTAEVTPADPELGWRLRDQGGPILMAVCLGIAAWWSRSLVPGILAAAILAVLFPELQRQYQRTFEAIGWGNGLGSAGGALALLGLCFGLRRWLPERLAGGDRFLGEHDFPLRREDHTLFTWPLLGTAFYLAAKLPVWVAPGPLTK